MTMNDKTETAKQFIRQVKTLAEQMKLNVFVVTDGASFTNNNGNECVRFHREKQIEWEKENGFDPNETWDQSKNFIEKSNKYLYHKTVINRK